MFLLASYEIWESIGLRNGHDNLLLIAVATTTTRDRRMFLHSKHVFKV
jgi:hypothetical protein